jgi:hypothetical protein
MVCCDQLPRNLVQNLRLDHNDEQQRRISYIFIRITRRCDGNTGADFYLVSSVVAVQARLANYSSLASSLPEDLAEDEVGVSWASGAAFARANLADFSLPALAKGLGFPRI